MKPVVTRTASGTLSCTLSDGTPYSCSDYGSDNYRALLATEDLDVNARLNNKHAREKYTMDLENYQIRVQTGAIPTGTPAPVKPKIQMVRNPVMDEDGMLAVGVLVEVDWA